MLSLEYNFFEIFEIAEAFELNLDALYAALGTDHLNRLDLLTFCYFMYSGRTENFDPVMSDQLNLIFGS